MLMTRKLVTFRFELEDDYDDEISLKVFWCLPKKIDIPESSIVHFLPK